MYHDIIKMKTNTIIALILFCVVYMTPNRNVSHDTSFK